MNLTKPALALTAALMLGGCGGSDAVTDPAVAPATVTVTAPATTAEPEPELYDDLEAGHWGPQWDLLDGAFYDMTEGEQAALCATWTADPEGSYDRMGDNTDVIDLDAYLGWVDFNC